MRIPLKFMQECVSLMPGDPGYNNILRQLFEDGMHGMKCDETKLILMTLGDIYNYTLQTCHKHSNSRRLGSLESRLTAWFLPRNALELLNFSADELQGGQKKFVSLWRPGSRPSIHLENLLC